MDRDQILITPELLYVDDRNKKWYDETTRSESYHVNRKSEENAMLLSSQVSTISGKQVDVTPPSNSDVTAGVSNFISSPSDTQFNMYSLFPVEFYLLCIFMIVIAILFAHINKLYSKIGKLKMKMKDIKQSVRVR